jgi:hypothetical protein
MKAIVLLSLLVGTAVADERPTCAVPLTILSVLDGDTIKADIRCPFGLTIRDRTIRAADFDAWESSRHRQTVNVTDVEIVRGKKAQKELTLLLSNDNGFDDWKLYAEDTGRQDAYGRILAVLWIRENEGWTRLGSWMRDRFHVRDALHESK